MPSTLPCPTCGRPVLVEGDDRPKSFPFCSERCRNRDLGAWFAGRYTVAGSSPLQDDPDAPSSSDQDRR